MNELAYRDLLWSILDDSAEADLVRAAVAELDRILVARPDASSDLISIFESSLRKPWSQNTWPNLNERLAVYLGSEAGSLFTWVILGDAMARLDRLSEHASEAAGFLIRMVTSLFGRDISKCVRFNSGWTDDWDYTYTDVVVEQVSNTFRLSIDITKDNGDRCRIEGPPDSIIDLVNRFLDMLSVVGSREFFSSEILDVFIERVDRVSETLRPTLGGSEVVSDQGKNEP